MPNTDPVDLIGGLADTGNVSKVDFRAYEKARNVGVFATCAEVRGLDLSGRTRIIAGSRFFRKDTSDVSADDMTEATPVIVDDAGNHWMVIEGERYDITFSTSGLLGDAETLPPVVILTPLTIPASLPGSYLIASEDAPQGTPTITFEKSADFGANWSTAFTGTFTAAAREGAFSLVGDLTLPAGMLLRPKGPATHDPLMAGLVIGIAALR